MPHTFSDDFLTKAFPEIFKLDNVNKTVSIKADSNLIKEKPIIVNTENNKIKKDNILLKNTKEVSMLASPEDILDLRDFSNSNYSTYKKNFKIYFKDNYEELKKEAINFREKNKEDSKIKYLDKRKQEKNKEIVDIFSNDGTVQDRLNLVKNIKSETLTGINIETINKSISKFDIKNIFDETQYKVFELLGDKEKFLIKLVYYNYGMKQKDPDFNEYWATLSINTLDLAKNRLSLDLRLLNNKNRCKLDFLFNDFNKRFQISNKSNSVGKTISFSNLIDKEINYLKKNKSSLSDYMYVTPSEDKDLDYNIDMSLDVLYVDLDIN